MPFKIKVPAKRNLLAQGLPYQILFSFKKDSSKQIFKALRKDLRTGVQQEVLVKIFLKDSSSFREEFESLSQISSSYCVRLIGFESFAGKNSLILEYIPGVSLFKLIESFSLSSEEIGHILVSIYKGLLDLNRQNLCHGDLSLDNVLIDEKAHIKLIDFGKANYERGTQGTAPFMAPEILKGARANFLSDLYSLGVIETLLRTPCPLTSLKDLKAEDLSQNNPLLFKDPKKRFFPESLKNQDISFEQLRFLSYKVKELLSLAECRRQPTLKNSCSKRSAFFPAFVKSMVFFLFLLFAGMASSPPYISYGWVKVYTNEWFVVRVDGFQSYTPLALPLKPGWRFIEWRNRQSQGIKKIFISEGKAVFLNDQSFLSDK